MSESHMREENDDPDIVSLFRAALARGSRLSSRQRFADPKSDVIGAPVGGVSATVRGPHNPRTIVPIASPHHAQIAISSGPSTAVLRSFCIGFVPAILGPLPSVAEHIR
jgi:hypothetical protein